MCHKTIKCDHKHSHKDRAKSQTTISFKAVQSNEDGKRRCSAENVSHSLFQCTTGLPWSFINHDQKWLSTFEDTFEVQVCINYLHVKYCCCSKLIESLLDSMNEHPLSLSIDGSNDADLDLEKMNPLTPWIFDVNSDWVVTRFLDMCTSISASAEGIYSMMNDRLTWLLQRDDQQVTLLGQTTPRWI